MEKIKSNSILIIVVAVVLLFVGFLVVGNTTARADGGTCVLKVNDRCLVDWAREVSAVQDEIQALAVLAPDEEVLGAGSSHDTDPSMKVGNVERFYARQIMRQGTTTICSFITPAATSTITGGLVSFDVGSTSASIISVAKATTAFATTTVLISDVALAADIHGTIQIDPAVAATLDATQILAPSIYVNVGIQMALTDGGEESETGYYANAAPVGSCSVEFMVI